jgi:arabinose-5-phosphate isomerase
MKDIARKVFEIEIESLQRVAGLIGDEFLNAVDTILLTKGKLIVSGIGKSGLIGKKIAATLASTGTPAFFLHPGEAFHGDLGMIAPDDLVILISYSGETDEVLRMIPFLKWNKNVIISITGHPASTIAKNSDHHLDVSITREACPLELAPTSSTTTTLVMGDALAITLMEKRNFKHADFARFHPGGSLGRKLLVKVKDQMRTENLPFIAKDASFMELILKMSEGRLGLVIIGNHQKVEGVITDGDLRRALVLNPDTGKLLIEAMMTHNPQYIDENATVLDAEQQMIEKKIATILVGVPDKKLVKGIYQIFNK